jgi:hypothetical protein
MITKKCDICKKNFTSTDDYVDGNIDLTCVEYGYDAGSLDVKKHYDTCQKCLKKVYDFIEKQKKAEKAKSRKKK